MFGKLLVLFIVVPLVELFIFIGLSDLITLPVTLLIIVATAVLGAALTKSQGRKALEKFQRATSQGKMPAREGLEGLMVLLAGAVLITPGFLTDAIGFSLLIPPVRTMVAAYLGERLKGRIKVVTPGGMGAGPVPDAELRRKSKLDDGKVIDV